MSDQDFVYGVFKGSDKAFLVVSELHKAGLKTSEIAVLGNKTEQFRYLSGKIEDQTLKHFAEFGMGGCILGLIAGIAGAPHIPFGQSFQIIVPFMATISGGAAFAYFGCWMGAFLHANQPQHWASAFEGTVEGGDIIILAEPQNRAQRSKTIEILHSHNPSELIFRRKPWGQLASTMVEPATEGSKEPEDRKLTAVA